VPRIVRAGVEALPEQLGGDDLAASRPDRGIELADETGGVAVGREHDLFCLELAERPDPLVLP